MRMTGFLRKATTYCQQLLASARHELQRLKMARHHPPGWFDYPFVSTEDPIVIGGSGRSGTTLLSVILNAHSMVSCGPEFGLLSNRDFSLEHCVEYLGFDKGFVTRLARQTSCRVHFLEEILREEKKQKGISVLATKYPPYVFELPTIFAAFPNAKFIYMHRDGRDVAVSVRENQAVMGPIHGAAYDKDGLWSIQTCAQNWRTYVNAYRPYQHDSRCHAIRYEELVCNPEATIRRMCAFLGLPWEDGLLEFHVKGTQGRSDLGWVHLAGVTKPLFKDKIERWREALLPEQVREYEDVAKAELLYLGYELAGEPSTGVTAQRNGNSVQTV
jgi:hypothetical protein